MSTASGRHLDWEGCFNVRDLGGLATTDGAEIRWGAAVRADAIDELTARGWARLEEHGVRTVVDLRNDDERRPDAAHRPETVTTEHVPLDCSEDREFWHVWDSGPQFGTPLYYRPHLERFPERSVAVIGTIAHAEPGGVVFHCGGGRDRVGQITMLMLALAGVAPQDIAADYMLSYERLPARYAAHGEPDQGPTLEAYLEDLGLTASEAIVRVLAEFDLEAHLRCAGLSDDDLVALRTRLLGPGGGVR